MAESPLAPVMIFARRPIQEATKPRPTADALLADMGGPAVGAAFAQALPTAATREHETLVERLLESGSVTGRLALVRHLHRLEPRAAARVSEAADQGLDAAVRRAFGSGTDATRNALRLIGQRQLGHLSYLVVDATSLPRRDLADEAAAVLARLAAEAVPGSTQAANLAAAVDPAVANWGLRGGEVGCHEGLLTAFLLLSLESLPAAREALSSPDHPAVAPLSRRLSRAAGAAERGALLPLLAVAPLSEAVLGGLAVAARERAFRGVFPDLTILLDPAIASLLAGVEHPARLCPAAWPTEASCTERSGWLRLMSLLPLAPETRGRWIALALADPAPRVRSLALGLAARSVGRGAACRPLAEAAAKLAAEGSAEEARLAAGVALAAAGGRPSSVLPSLAASPHATARAMGERTEADLAADAVLHGWEQADAAERTNLLQACLGRPGGEARLRARLSPGATSDNATRRGLAAIRSALGLARLAMSDPARESAPQAPPAGREAGTAPAQKGVDAALEELEDRLDRNTRHVRIASSSLRTSRSLLHDRAGR